MFGGFLLLVLSACSPVKLLNALTPDSTFDKTAGIAYGDDPRQKLDVYVPRHALPDAPVVVFFYGGSWNSGAREDYNFVGEALASRGIVAVVADYHCIRRCVIHCFCRTVRGRWHGPRRTSASFPAIHSVCT